MSGLVIRLGPFLLKLYAKSFLFFCQSDAINRFPSCQIALHRAGVWLVSGWWIWNLWSQLHLNQPRADYCTCRSLFLPLGKQNRCSDHKFQFIEQKSYLMRLTWKKNCIQELNQLCKQRVLFKQTWAPRVCSFSYSPVLRVPIYSEPKGKLTGSLLFEVWSFLHSSILTLLCSLFSSLF